MNTSWTHKEENYNYNENFEDDNNQKIISYRNKGENMVSYSSYHNYEPSGP